MKPIIKRRRGFKLGPKAVRVQQGPSGSYDVEITVLAPGVAEGADSWGPTGLQNPGSGQDYDYRPYDPEDDPADSPAFDLSGHWDDEDIFHPEGYSHKQTRELEDEIRHTRGSWASGWADRSRK